MSAANLPGLVGGLQAFCGLSWLIALADFSDAPRRWWRGRLRADDKARLWLCAISAVNVGFTLRWLTLGRDDVREMAAVSLEVWAALYLVSGVAAQGLVHAWRPIADCAGPLYEAELRLPRQSGWLAVGLWVAIALACGAGGAWLGA